MMYMLRNRLRKLQINFIIEIHQKTGAIDIDVPDLKYFKQQTTKGAVMSNAIIMGRKTYETINKPLPNRHNYIISTSINEINGCHVHKTLDQSITAAIANSDIETIWICGGKQVYEDFLERYLPDKLYIVDNLTAINNGTVIMDRSKLIPSDDSNNFNYVTKLVHSTTERQYLEYDYTSIDNKLDEDKYIKLVKNIIFNGFYQLDRTKVGTLTQHGAMLRINLRNKVLPIISSRQAFYRGSIEEFLWMLKGETDVSMLQNKNIHIWDGNTTKEFIKNRGLEGVVPENNIGALYGYQIRNWGGDWDKWIKEGERTGIDQLERLINSIKNDPGSRRHLISNYNVSQLDLGVLEPCHTLYSFTVDEINKEIHSTLFMRSTDTCCGLVLNVIHIALLTHILAEVLSTDNVKYSAGDLVFMGNNVHIYSNHIETFMLQSYRRYYNFPTIEFNKPINNLADIESLDYAKDIKIVDYKCNKPLKYQMAI